MSKFSLFFILAFIGGIIAALAYAPVAAFLTYQLIYFLNPESRWWAAGIPSLRYSLITVLVMLLVLMIKYRELTRLSPWSDQPIFKWLLALLAMYYFMYLHALLPALHWRFTFEFTKLIVIIFVAYKLLNTHKALNAALWAFIAGAAYIGYVATNTGRNAFGRVEGIGMVDTGSDGNMTAAALVPPLMLLMYYAWMGTWKVKLLCAVFAAFILNGLVLINSRGAFLGALAGGMIFLVYMLFSKYQRKGQRFMAILIIVTGVTGALSLTDDTFWDRMQTLQQVDDGGASGSHRVEFWMATFDVLKDYPLGVGIEGYVFVSQNYLPEHYFENRTTGKAVHSTWFQLLAELGWPGPVLFACLLICVFRLSRATKKYLLSKQQTDIYFKMLALEAGLIGFLVAASFIDRFRAEVLYWMILFIAAAANVYYLQSKRSAS